MTDELDFNSSSKYLIEMKNIEDYNAIFGKLEYYINQLPTILYPLKHPTKLQSPTAEDTNKYLSDTKQAQWVKIKKKCVMLLEQN